MMTTHSIPLLLLLSLSWLVVLSSLALPIGGLVIPRVLSSHMVLQRETATTVWGMAAPNSTVVVTMDDDPQLRFSATANSGGNWSVALPPQAASTLPHSLAIAGDGQTFTLSDVLFGDVFLCSGQSNMEFVLQDVFNATAEIEDSGRYPFLRLFTIADDQSSRYLNDTESRFLKNESWVVSSPQYTNGTEWLYYSALCWLYGRNLHRALQQQIPVGLIESCYGGTPVETWSDVDAIDQCGAIHMDEEATQLLSQSTEEQSQLERAVGNYEGPHGPKAPYLLYNAMIAPIVQYKLKAILWYQGEDNASNATNYRCRFPALIESWRRHWQQPNLPFLFVLLAGYTEGAGHWAPTRAAQLAALRLPNVGVSTAHDLGDRNNSVEGDIHSRNKSLLATRMTALALHDIYGHEDVIGYGPVAGALVWPAGNPTDFSIQLPFITNGSVGRYAQGLHFLGTAECIACCTLEGSPVQLVLSNKTTIRAAVSLKGSVLMATATLADGVRVDDFWFNYEAYPECAVYNSAGLPALPFATAHPRTPAEPGDTVTVAVSSLKAVSPPVLPNYIGFSLEWDIATSWTGRLSTAPRPSFIALMRQLMLTPGQEGPTFRIGGDSATHSWYNPKHLPIPPIPRSSGDYNISDDDLVSLGKGVQAINSSLVIGLNFRLQNNASWAIAHVQACERLIGWKWVKGLEIANEPDLLSPTYRPAGWGIAQWYDEFDQYTAAIKKAVPSLPAKVFQGAAYASVKAWVEDLPSYVARFQAILYSVSQHSYSGCADAIPPPTMADLLSDASALKERTFITSGTNESKAKVEAMGVEFLVGEGNSICHSGQPNVSDAFGVNLWMLDEAMNNVAVGLSHFFWHSHDRDTTHYPPLVWRSYDSDTPSVEPLWYGLRLFAMATSHYAYQVNHTVNTSNPAIKVWITYSNSTRALKVLLLHKDLRALSSASVHLDLSSVLSSFPVGELIRLEAPSAEERFNITLAGQCYQGTTAGEPVGNWTATAVAPSAMGMYSIQLPPISVALLTVRVPQLRQSIALEAMREVGVD